MKKLCVVLSFVSVLFGCSSNARISVGEIEAALSVSEQQALLMAEKLIVKEGKLPRTVKDGKLQTAGSKWWTSGFFPGVLWYLYENSSNEKMKQYAEEFTKRVEKEQYTTRNHDVGFILYCSFGNGLRIVGKESYAPVLLQGAESLSTRFRPVTSCIRSWDWNREVWQYPVIIDNMMNLELLMWAGKTSGNEKFIEIAKSHADATLKNHFRPDFSCYHVVSYDTISGLPEKKVTCQGYSDESSWARGQAWALYGYTMMYRETKDSAYLNHAISIARYIMDHPGLPEDKIPYWDFDDPEIPSALRDASAAAIMASAFIELSLYAPGETGERCLFTAEKQLKTLSSPEYLAKPGTNFNFILKHSVGNKPGGSEVDVPLAYADYYFVEALMRYKKEILKK